MAYRLGTLSSHRKRVATSIICLIAYCSSTLAPTSAAAMATTAKPVVLATAAGTSRATNALALPPGLTSSSSSVNTPESRASHYLRAFSAAYSNNASSELMGATAGPSAHGGSGQQPGPSATHALQRAFRSLLAHLRLWSLDGSPQYPHHQKALAQQHQRHGAQNAPGQTEVRLASRRGLRGAAGEGGGGSSSSSSSSSSSGSSSPKSQAPEVNRHTGTVCMV